MEKAARVTCIWAFRDMQELDQEEDLQLGKGKSRESWVGKSNEAAGPTGEGIFIARDDFTNKWGTKDS